MAGEDSHLILVIGATGTVGTQLVAQLTQEGYRVRALTRDPQKAAEFGNNVEVVMGDLNDQNLDCSLAGSRSVLPHHGQHTTR